MAALLLTVLCGLLACGQPAAAVRVTPHAEGPRYSLRASDAPLAEVARELTATGACELTVDETLAGRRVSLSLAPRSLERLVVRLAREAEARLTVRYCLRPPAEGETLRRNRWSFARDPVELDALRMPVREAADALGPVVEVRNGVSGPVTLRAEGQPLGWALDGIAAQTRSVWKPVLRLEPRNPAGELERMHEHLSELSWLSSRERQEEISEELERLDALPRPEREAAVSALAQDISGLGSLLRRVPGEHRGGVGRHVVAVARDYARVLSRPAPGGKAHPAPLLDAIRKLERELMELR